MSTNVFVHFTTLIFRPFYKIDFRSKYVFPLRYPFCQHFQNSLDFGLHTSTCARTPAGSLSRLQHVLPSLLHSILLHALQLPASALASRALTACAPSEWATGNCVRSHNILCSNWDSACSESTCIHSPSGRHRLLHAHTLWRQGLRWLKLKEGQDKPFLSSNGVTLIISSKSKQ